MNIEYKKNKRTIEHRNGKLYEKTAENMKKVLLQDVSIFLNEDLSWNRTFLEAIQVLRVRRDREIRKSDFLFLKDTTEIYDPSFLASVEIKRQGLRDLTEGLSTVEDVLEKIKELNKLV